MKVPYHDILASFREGDTTTPDNVRITCMPPSAATQDASVLR